MSADIQPWDWPEEHWRGVVGHGRAGRSLAPKSWPGGARCCVALSFDPDHETNPLGENDPYPSRISQGQYGSRRGLPRIRALLRQEGISASFYYPAVSAMLHPEELPGLVEEGHEIGIHSWIHESNLHLGYDVERDLTLRAADVLERLSGVRPVGMRTASWDFSPHTLSIMCEMGLLYDSSLMADDEPYELMDAGKPVGLIEIPVEWIRDDAPYLSMRRKLGARPYTAPSAVEEIYKAEFDGAWKEGGLFQLTLHPHHIGHRSRMPVLERLIAHIKARGDCWFATHAQVATWCRDNAAA